MKPPVGYAAVTTPLVIDRLLGERAGRAGALDLARWSSATGSPGGWRGCRSRSSPGSGARGGEVGRVVVGVGAGRRAGRGGACWTASVPAPVPSKAVARAVADQVDDRSGPCAGTGVALRGQVHHAAACRTSPACRSRRAWAGRPRGWRRRPRPPGTCPWAGTVPLSAVVRGRRTGGGAVLHAHAGQRDRRRRWCSGAR